MKKVNIVIIVVIFIAFINKIYASQKIDVNLYTNTNQINENDTVQINIDLGNLDREKSIKCISAYLYFDKAVFENLSNKDILVNNKFINDCYDENIKKLYCDNTLKLNNNYNLLTINLRVKENVNVNSGYFELKQLYIIDENNKKIDFNDKSIKFKISPNYANDTDKASNVGNISNIKNVNSISNIDNAKVSSLSNMENLDKFENIFNVPIIPNIPKVFSIPFEGMWIIIYSFIIVIAFRVIVSIIYKTSLRIHIKYKQISQIKRIDKIFKNINTRIIE